MGIICENQILSPKWVFIIISHKDFITTNSLSNRDSITNNNQRVSITTNNQRDFTTNNNPRDFTTTNNHKDFITTKLTLQRHPLKRRPQRTFPRHGRRTKTPSPCPKRQRNTPKPKWPPS